MAAGSPQLNGMFDARHGDDTHRRHEFQAGNVFPVFLFEPFEFFLIDRPEEFEGRLRQLVRFILRNLESGVPRERGAAHIEPFPRGADEFRRKEIRLGLVL